MSTTISGQGVFTPNGFSEILDNGLNNRQFTAHFFTGMQDFVNEYFSEEKTVGDAFGTLTNVTFGTASNNTISLVSNNVFNVTTAPVEISGFVLTLPGGTSEIYLCELSGASFTSNGTLTINLSIALPWVAGQGFAALGLNQVLATGLAGKTLNCQFANSSGTSLGSSFQVSYAQGASAVSIPESAFIDLSAASSDITIAAGNTVSRLNGTFTSPADLFISLTNLNFGFTNQGTLRVDSLLFTLTN